MRMNAKVLVLAAALLLAACAQPFAGGGTPTASPIKLTVGGYYSAAAGFTTGGH